MIITELSLNIAQHSVQSSEQLVCCPGQAASWSEGWLGSAMPVSLFPARLVCDTSDEWLQPSPSVRWALM